MAILNAHESRTAATILVSRGRHLCDFNMMTQYAIQLAKVSIDLLKAKRGVDIAQADIYIFLMCKNFY